MNPKKKIDKTKKSIKQRIKIKKKRKKRNTETKIKKIEIFQVMKMKKTHLMKNKMKRKTSRIK